MRKRWPILVVLLLAIIIVAINERPSRYYSKPKTDIALIDGLVSGSSMSSVSNTLTRSGYSPRSSSGQYPSVHANQFKKTIAPKIQMGKIAITNYVFEGLRGALVMDYFNGYLWASGFSCTNRDVLASIVEKYGTSPSVGEYLTLSNGVVLSWREKDDWAAIGFIDPRYRKQLDRWQRRFQYVMNTK